MKPREIDRNSCFSVAISLNFGDFQYFIYFSKKLIKIIFKKSKLNESKNTLRVTF